MVVWSGDWALQLPQTFEGVAVEGGMSSYRKRVQSGEVLTT